MTKGQYQKNDSMQNKGGEISSANFPDEDSQLLFLRHLFAYEAAAQRIKPGSRILEVGCGDGYGTLFLADCERDFEIKAIDINEEIIERINKNSSREECRFSPYDGAHIPYEDSAFDAVISFQVIEHVPNESAFLKELCRVLAPGGKVFISTPNRSYRLKPGQTPWNRHHIREYLPKELADVLGSFFQSVELFGISGASEILEREYKRVARLRDGRGDVEKAIDKLKDGLAHIVPGPIRRALKGASQTGKIAEHNGSGCTNEHSTSEYWLTDSEIEEALDIFCIATKNERQ